MHPALQITLFHCLYHGFLSEHVDGTDVSAKSCCSMLKCRKKGIDFTNHPNECLMQETSKIVFCVCIVHFHQFGGVDTPMCMDFTH